MTQFTEPLAGVSGYDPSYGGVQTGFPYNVVDKVVVPKDLEPGEYILSWRTVSSRSRSGRTVRTSPCSK